MMIQIASKRIAATMFLSAVLLGGQAPSGQAPEPTKVTVPRTWDDSIMPTLEVPLANPIGSPKQISADYYYKIPVRPIYKQYPVYAPGREPAGYKDWLKKQDPVLLWDDAGTKPELKTDADWIRAGEMVFSAPIGTCLARRRQGFEKYSDRVACNKRSKGEAMNRSAWSGFVLVLLVSGAFPKLLRNSLDERQSYRWHYCGLTTNHPKHHNAACPWVTE
jgi:hypothetical protein